LFFVLKCGVVGFCNYFLLWCGVRLGLGLAGMGGLLVILCFVPLGGAVGLILRVFLVKSEFF
jgi:hypothetical protein